VDKGFPAPKYPDLFKDGDYIHIPKNQKQSYLNPDRTVAQASPQTSKYRVAMFFDGPFFPIRNGACYTIYNLMRALGENPSVEIGFLNCYRG